MSQNRKYLRFTNLESVYFVVLIGANLIAAISMSAMSSLIRTESYRDLYVSAYQGLSASWLVNFLVPSLLCVRYLKPFGQLHQGGPPSALVKRRVLNGPLIMSLISMTGWLVGIAIFLFGVYLNDVPLTWNAVGRMVLDNLLIGSLVFVIAYYLLEFISRKYFLPRYFPHGELSTVEGVINLSIRARFMIFFYAVAIFPAFLFLNIIAVMAGETGLADVVSAATALTAVVVILGAFVTYLVSGAYQTPLVEMKQATEKIRIGDYETRVRVVSTDEIGLLGEALNEMAVGLKERELLKEAHERVKQELAMAWRIQESFLPKALPDVPGWQLTATLEPARQTSGDFYDLIPLPNGQLGLLVADVTDKGMGAALYMALSCTILRTFAGEYHSQPDRVLSAAHRRILADTDTNQFVTVFYGVLDPATGMLTYSNAGHNPPFLLHDPSNGRNGAGSDQPVEFKELSNTGPPLGLRMFKDITWEKNTVRLGSGNVLVLYSDGVTEAQDVREELFEEERLLELLQANVGHSAQSIQDMLMAEVHDFVGLAPQSDDITLMVLVRD